MVFFINTFITKGSEGAHSEIHDYLAGTVAPARICTTLGAEGFPHISLFAYFSPQPFCMSGRDAGNKEN